MPRRFVIPLLLLFFCAVILQTMEPVQSQEEPSATFNEDQIQTLLEERRETCRKLVEVVMAEHNAGLTTLHEVINSRNGLLEAELEIVSTKADRVKIRKQFVENFRQIEKDAETRLELGIQGGTPAIRLSAKSVRLRAEIELHREQFGR